MGTGAFPPETSESPGFYTLGLLPPIQIEIHWHKAGPGIVLTFAGGGENMGIPGMCPWCAHRFLQKLQENTPGLLLLDSPVSICRKMPAAAPQIDSLTHSWKHTGGSGHNAKGKGGTVRHWGLCWDLGDLKNTLHSDVLFTPTVCS